jgi:hypothetical protein
MRRPVAKGINTVCLSYIRQHTGHGLIRSRQWIPLKHVDDGGMWRPMGAPADLALATKGKLAVRVLCEANPESSR